MVTRLKTLGTQHVIYRADDGHIIELSWENGVWSQNDLTVAAGVTVAVDSAPTGYAFEAQGTRHVNFRGVDGHIYDCGGKMVFGCPRMI